MLALILVLAPLIVSTQPFGRRQGVSEALVDHATLMDHAALRPSVARAAEGGQASSFSSTALTFLSSAARALTVGVGYHHTTLPVEHLDSHPSDLAKEVLEKTAVPLHNPPELCGLAMNLDDLQTAIDEYADPAPRLNDVRLALIGHLNVLWRDIQLHVPQCFSVAAAAATAADRTGSPAANEWLVRRFAPRLPALRLFLQRNDVKDVIADSASKFCTPPLPSLMRIGNGLGLHNYALNNCGAALAMLPRSGPGARELAAPRREFKRIAGLARGLWRAFGAVRPRGESAGRLWVSLRASHQALQSLVKRLLRLAAAGAGTALSAAMRAWRSPPACVGLRAATARAAATHAAAAAGRPLGATVRLSNGVQMPRLAFGTAHLGTAVQLFTGMMEDGYTHVDLAQGYGDIEVEFGRFVKSGRLHAYNKTRGDLFVTSKVSYLSSFGARETRAAVLAALERTRAGHFDLMLLHSLHFERGRIAGAWRALHQLQREGKVRAIGLSNVEVAHVRWLVVRTGITPQVIQNVGALPYPGHELVDQPDMFAYAREHGIVVEGYSVVGKSDNSWLPSVRDPHVAEIARQVRRSPGEVVLNWFLRMGGSAATQSLSAKHRRAALRAPTVPLTLGQLSFLNRVAAMYHTQPGTPGFPVAELGGFSCAGGGDARHRLVRPFCQSPPYRVAPPAGVVVSTGYDNSTQSNLDWNE
jgi:diketogulonate reductase-like aldo/keto reductase